MAVRPFYVHGKIDGRASLVHGGPKSGTGNMEVSIFQRDQGDVTVPYEIVTSHKFEEDGTHKLITEVRYFGKKIHSHESEY